MASENKDYSQFGEQNVITKYFANRKGSFLDIGAYDGQWCSNTHAIALAGWDGVCVEANPLTFARLMASYKQNNNVVLLNAFMAIESGITQFFCADEISTNDINHLAQFGTKSEQTIYMPTIDLQSIKDNFKEHFEFISIDVEGSSVELFKQALQIFKPELICVEHEHQQDDCTNYAINYGYKPLYINGVNMIFVNQ